MAEWINGIGKLTVPTPLRIGNVNLYLLKGDSLTLVDAGMKTDQTWAAFQYELHELGYTPDDIEQIVLTHHHIDHVGLLDYLPNAVIYGHPYCASWLNHDHPFIQEFRRFYQQLFKRLGIPPSFYTNIQKMEQQFNGKSHVLSGELIEGMAIPGHPNWKVIETVGHAQSHLSFYQEKEHNLIGGDHILAHISSTPILEPPIQFGMERPKPFLQYMNSLEKIKIYPINQIFTGHGHQVKNVNPLIDRRLMQKRKKALEIKDILLTTEMNSFETCQTIFPKAYQKDLRATMSLTVGFLDYLQLLGEIASHINEEGIEYYFAKP